MVNFFVMWIGRKLELDDYRWHWKKLKESEFGIENNRTEINWTGIAMNWNWKNGIDPSPDNAGPCLTFSGKHLKNRATLI